MTTPKNVPLIQRRADARTLEEQIKAHRKECPDLPKCGELARMRAELNAVREEIRTWFDPGPDTKALFL